MTYNEEGAYYDENAPEIDKAVEACAQADLLIVIGTSLNVYPAAGLTRCVPSGTPIYLIDPQPVAWNSDAQVHHIMKGASEGMRTMDGSLLKLYREGRITKDTALISCVNYENMIKRLG